MSATATATEEIPEIENSEQQSFIKFYRGLQTAEEGTIHTVYQTTTVIKYWFGDERTGVPTTKLTQKVAENFLRDVLLN
ncbi:unnamed protein product [Mucor hiemalis]